MEPLSSFYQTRLLGRLVTDEKSKHIEPHTLTVKFGMSKNIPKRGISAEFLSYGNAATKKNPSIGKYEVTEEIHMLEVDGQQSCCRAPLSLIADWESFVNTRFYDKSPRLFQDAGTKGSKHEYLETPQETEARVDFLNKTIKKYASKFAELAPQYLELTDGQPVLIKKMYDEYRLIFDSMKKTLNNYGLKTTKKAKTDAATVASQPSSQQTVAPPVLQDVFGSLESDWTLCTFKGTTIYGLQHNTYHAENGNLKSPSLNYNILLADSAIKDARFQFHSNAFLNSRYTPYNANAARVIEILTKAGKVRHFDVSQLPPKGQKMLQAKQKASIPTTKPVTNGVNHHAPVVFTNI